MTTVFSVSQTCAVCGAVSEQQEIGSTNTIGPPDLDLRPAPMARWTLAEQIQQCPECGYCAWDISAINRCAREVVANEAYQAELSREDYPELTRRYLCASLLLSVAGDDAGAGRAALMGAWAADDLAGWETPEDADRTAAGGAAAHCRRLAIGYLEADRKHGLTFAADDASADALLADLNRRVGDFEAARVCALAGLERGGGSFVQDLLRFQLALVDACDVDCHSMSEVEDGED